MKKKRGEFLPNFGISVTFCQIFTPKKEKKKRLTWIVEVDPKARLQCVK
jgi:hypothetical protein